MSDISKRKLAEAINARNKRKLIEGLIEEKRKEAEELREQAKNARVDRLKAEKELNSLEDEEKKLTELAGYKEEDRGIRGKKSSKAFFDLLNKFDEHIKTDEEKAAEINDGKKLTFSQQYNSLENTPLVIKLFFESLQYDNNSDKIIIDGKLLREKVKRCMIARKNKIDEIRSKVDLEWEKVLPELEKKNKKKKLTIDDLVKKKEPADSVKVSQDTFQENQ